MCPDHALGCKGARPMQLRPAIATPARPAAPVTAPARRRGFDVWAWRRRSEGWAIRLFTFLMLVDVAFVFLFPLFYMVATSVKSVQDLTDRTIYWLARDPQWGNYCFAFKSLEMDKWLMAQWPL